jgi:hypothetical protein
MGGSSHGGEASDIDLDRSNDGPNLEENAVDQRAILACFESLKQTEGDARARKEANKEQWCCAVNFSIQRAPIEEMGRRFFVEEWQWLLEGEAEHLELSTVLRRERQRATVDKREKEGGDDDEGPSSTPKDDE